ncbi:hypothetical protein ACEQPO_26920 [Bacillus sp. SL00103]
MYYLLFLFTRLCCFLSNDNFRIHALTTYDSLPVISVIYTLPIIMAIIIFIKHRKGKV